MTGRVVAVSWRHVYLIQIQRQLQIRYEMNALGEYVIEQFLIKEKRIKIEKRKN